MSLIPHAVCRTGGDESPSAVKLSNWLFKDMVDKIGLRFDASSGRRPSTQYITVINGETGITFRISFYEEELVIKPKFSILFEEMAE